jgi:hypothetical protein
MCNMTPAAVELTAAAESQVLREHSTLAGSSQ